MSTQYDFTIVGRAPQDFREKIDKYIMSLGYPAMEAREDFGIIYSIVLIDEKDVEKVEDFARDACRLAEGVIFYDLP